MMKYGLKYVYDIGEGQGIFYGKMTEKIPSKALYYLDDVIDENIKNSFTSHMIQQIPRSAQLRGIELISRVLNNTGL